MTPVGRSSNILCMKSDLTKTGLLGRLIQDLRLLAALLGDYWRGTYREVSIASITVFSLAAVYILSPLDLIPDWIVGLGQIDDAAVLLLCLVYLEKDLFKYRDWKQKNEEA